MLTKAPAVKAQGGGNFSIMGWYRWVMCTLILLPGACAGPSAEGPELAFNRDSIVARKQRVFERYQPLPIYDTRTGLAASMAKAGLVNVREMDPNIRVTLAYATPNNFLDTAIYGSLQDAYLRIEAAAMLSLAQDELSRRQPGWHLLVLDAARPNSVQQAMWERVKDSPEARYVANPAVGSLHSYGAAVDLTLIQADGNIVDMGTPFDHFGPEAQPRYEGRYKNSGRLNTEQLANRRLLRDVMESAGFQGIPSEWWHFNAFGLTHVKENFPLLP